MKNKINFFLIEYAISSLLRQKLKNGFILSVLIVLTALLSTIFFISNSIKHELFSTLKSLPDITVQNLKAGRHHTIETALIDDFLDIKGVEDASTRVWGYYYFENEDVHFSVVGIDEFERQYKTSLNTLMNENFVYKAFEENRMVVGSGVYALLEKNYYKEYFNFIKPDGSFVHIPIGGVFKPKLQLEANDIILLPQKLAREIFDMKENEATDIVIKVANPQEILTIASKIKLMFPSFKVTTNKDLEISYQNIFDYKAGMFLSLFVVSIFTFFIIIFDKASGLNSTEKKEIGILKALGWRIEDVLKLKFYEGFILSFLGYVCGVLFALFFVYVLQAPLLRNIFTGYGELKTSLALPFVLDMNTLFLVFFLSVPIYIASIIIPSYRSATIETDKVLR